MDADMTHWTEEVRSALKRRNLTNHAAAVELRVSPATFASWMNGTTRPAVEKLSDIARLTGIAEWRLYSLAGYLPPSYDPSSAMLDAVARQQRLFREIQDWSQSSLNTSGHTTAAQVVGLLLQSDPTLEVHVRQNLKGNKYRVAPNTVIKITPTSDQSLDAVKRRITDSVGRALASVGAVWRTHDTPFGWTSINSLLLDVPEHERSRPVAGSPHEGLPSTMVFVGVPYAHAELVGSLVAEALGYAYINTRSDACASHELNIGIDQSVIASSARDRLMELCLDNPIRSSHMVQAFADPRIFDDFALEAMSRASSQILFVHVSARPTVIQYGANIWHLSAEACSLMEKSIDTVAALRSKSWTTKYVSDDVFHPGLASPDDQITDRAVTIAQELLDDWKVPDATRKGFLGHQSRR
ncbi:hypothetical protein CH262_25810 [Rhodococcus sp. 05-2255-1e]|uniref:helix-turn-helix domain-containing protein n=1 Tax=Rhodococcus sp. 05-2255-1e TaxID=2022495 RepID=UPI000B9C146B|nr:helix-turn-helix transcriptional regulator [Rhodococcus sp. 05-2255-1e]OZE17676.1 hypothetical protein CH262_25810 [Rhodococcus sp. 05-2255-1e]